MERTYQALNVNEIRAVELEINDQTGSDFNPSGAYAQVVTDAGIEVVAEQSAMVIGNTIYTIIGSTTTATVGEYAIIWRIVRGDYTYYHATTLEVVDL